MIAATTPPRTDGTTTLRTISQRVAPRPIAASLSCGSTLMNSSRQIDEMIGVAMIASTIIAMKTLSADGGGVPKIGMNPSTSWSAGSM